MTRVLRRIQVNGQIVDVDVTADATMVRPAGYGESGDNDWASTGEPLRITPGAHIANGAIDATVDVGAISAISAGAGTDTFNLAAFNTALSGMVGEINTLKSAYNSLAGKYNDLAGKFNTLLSQLESQGINLSS